MPVLVRETGIDDSTVEFWKIWMSALRKTNPGLLAYLSYMTLRLAYMRMLLRPTGSLYLHCDPTAAHYIKVMLDGVFGHANFRNEIIWQRTSSHNDSRKWGGVHDTLLFYSKSDSFTWNPAFMAHDPAYVRQFYRYSDGRGVYRLHEIIRTESMVPRPNLTYEYKGYTPQWGWRVVRSKLEALDADNGIVWSRTGRPYRKRYLSDHPGSPIRDVVTDIPPIAARAAERLGYATQKPLALLERIIAASTNEGDVVLDPFCGCATTLEAAHKLHRKWIGIDIAIHAVKRVARIRLADRCGLVEGDRLRGPGCSARRGGCPRPVEARQISLPEMGG